MARHCIGLDIGSTAIKLVQLRTGRAGLVLENFGVEPVPAAAIAAGAVVDPAAVVAQAAVASCEDSPGHNVGARMVLLAKNNMALDSGSREAELQRLRGLALFHVVQARAGKCPVPA